MLCGMTFWPGASQTNLVLVMDEDNSHTIMKSVRGKRINMVSDGVADASVMGSARGAATAGDGLVRECHALPKLTILTLHGIPCCIPCMDVAPATGCTDYHRCIPGREEMGAGPPRRPQPQVAEEVEEVEEVR